MKFDNFNIQIYNIDLLDIYYIQYRFLNKWFDQNKLYWANVRILLIHMKMYTFYENVS